MKDPKDYPSRKLPKVVVRVPPGMREAIKELADREKRPVNTWIVQLIEQAVREDEERKRRLMAGEEQPNSYPGHEDDIDVNGMVENATRRIRREIERVVQDVKKKAQRERS